MVTSAGLATFACLVASASAFTTSPMALRSSSFAPSAISQRPVLATKASSSRAAAMPALRMQTEDEKAKASGVAFAIIGLIATKFSLIGAVILGGGAVYCAKLPEEGDKGLSDTAKQVSLLVGGYAMKAFDFAKEKDAEAGWTKDITKQAKEAIESAKGSIKQG